MTIFDEDLILETINMIKLHNFDIRTVTLAISLRDCLSEDINSVCDKIKYKLDKYAGNLVKYANDIENDYSIPIVNKRIAVTPVSLIGESCRQKDYIKIDGVVDVTLSACHTYAVESEKVRRTVEGCGKSYLQIETNYSNSDSGQLRTRLEAFVEML